MADRRRNLGIPSGTVFPFAGSAAPYGYLVCDGRQVSRTEYAQLFLSIGTTHGQGNGSTTFNLPDYRGMFLRGRVDVTTIAGTGPVLSNQATFTNHGINRTGFKIRLQSGTLTGLAVDTDYFVIVVNSNTLAFATSRANALANARIAISGTNTAVLTQWEDPDYTSRSAMNVGGAQNNVGSIQGDAIRNVVGTVTRIAETFASDGAGTGAFLKTSTGPSGSKTPANTDSSNTGTLSFDASRIVPVGGDNRPQNVYVNYIIKI